MTRRARRRRIGWASGLVAVATAFAAYASLGGPGTLTAEPEVVYIQALPNTSPMGSEALRNDGSGALFANELDVAPANCNDFTITPISPDMIPMTVGETESLDLNVTCHAPLVGGTIRSCQYTVRDATGIAIGQFRALCNVYNGATASAIGTVSSLDLGVWPVGTTSAPVDTVWTSNTETLSSISVWAADNSEVFKIQQPCSPTARVTGCTDVARAVIPGVEQQLRLTCRPDRVGLITSTVYLTGNTGAHGQLNVTCTGMMSNSTMLTASMDPIVHTTVPGTPISTTITIRNTGTGSANITGIIGVTAPWSATFGAGCPSGNCALAMGASFQLTATYSPTAAGTHNITPTIVSATGVGSLPLAWNGTAAGPGDIAVAPSVITRAFTMPIADTITISNTSAGPLKLTGAMMSGTGWTGPTNWSANCPTGTCMIPGGGSVTFDVTLQPSGPGDQDASVTIFSDDPDEPSVSVILDGSAETTINVMPTMYSTTAMVGMAGPPGVVDIQNTGAVPLTLLGATQTGSTAWTIQWPGTCLLGSCVIDPGNTVTFTATYLPLTTGAHQAFVSIESNAVNGPTTTVELNGNASASAKGQLSLETTSVTLTTDANMAVGATIRLKNIGGGPLTIAGHTMDVEPRWTSVWATCDTGCVMNSMDEFTFDVQFLSPGIATSVTSHLRIQSDDNGMPSTATIDLSGTALGSTIELNTDLGASPAIDLGSWPVATTSTEFTFELENTGNRATPTFELVVPPQYTVMPNLVTIAEFGTQLVKITCTPPSVGQFAGSLTLTNTGNVFGTTPNPFAIGLRCAGSDTQLVVSPQPIVLGEIRVGSEQRQTVTLSTVGDPLNVTTRALTGQNAQLSLGSIDSASIAPGAPAHFDVIATATADDDLADTLTVTAGADTAMVQITGKVVTPMIEYPSDIDLGTYCISRTPSAQTVAFEASATGAIQMTAAPALEAGTAFSLVHVTPSTVGYPYRLEAGEIASISVAPLARTTAGDVTDRVVWASDMPSQETAYTTVRAAFVASGGAVSPRSVSFKNTVVKQRSEHATITIENCDASPIALQPPAIDNPAFVDISVMPLPAQLQPSEKATIDVVFEPARAGATTGTLVVESSVGQLAVLLDGLGLGTGDDNLEKTGFYACSCASGDPATGAPIALALAGILRRRRRR